LIERLKRVSTKRSKSNFDQSFFYQTEEKWAVVSLGVVVDVGQAEGEVEGGGDAQEEDAEEDHPHACPVLVAVPKSENVC
jgi:hypothetical protein